MEMNNIISKEDVLNALILLKSNKKTRIPLNDIEKYISELKKDKVVN